jgi:hypothetical protein
MSKKEKPLKDVAILSAIVDVCANRNSDEVDPEIIEAALSMAQTIDGMITFMQDKGVCVPCTIAQMQYTLATVLRNNVEFKGETLEWGSIADTMMDAVEHGVKIAVQGEIREQLKRHSH